MKIIIYKMTKQSGILFNFYTTINHMLMCLIFMEMCNGSEIVEIMDNISAKTRVFDLKNICSGDKLPNSVLTSFPAHKYFYIDGDYLYTSRSIDMDKLCEESNLCCSKNSDICYFTIGISCRSNQQKDLSFIDIDITIKDLNDHSPLFENPSNEILIPESTKLGYIINLPVATDADFGKNSIETYRMQFMKPDSFDAYFKLNVDGTKPESRKAELRLTRTLDRETHNNYSFELLAIDGGAGIKQTGTTTITIKITDENDNMPKFVKTYFKQSVREGDFSANPIISLKAVDPDEKDNGKILYKLDPNNKHNDVIKNNFNIVEESGNIFLKHALNYERQSSFKFIVIAVNKAPLLNSDFPTSSATVEINVENVYDEPLNINIDYLNGKKHSIITENDKPQLIALITVKSLETNEYPSQISCKLENHTDILALNAKADKNIKEKLYDIQTTSQIDREIFSKIVASVACTESLDVNSPTYSASIQILVLDENDNSPIIRIQGNTIVRENTPIGTEILQIKALDKDDGDNGRVTFSLDKSEYITLDYLQIGEEDGIIRVKNVIDCEASFVPLANLTVIVTATDHGKDPKSSDLKFVISIKDENDNLPKFSTDPMIFSVEENNQPNSIIGDIEVEDKDYKDDITLELINPNPVSFPFKILPKPNTSRQYQLITTKSIDREKDSKFRFSVIAVDGRGTRAHTVTGSIEVNVIDKNDNPPIIIFPTQNNATRHIVSYLEPRNFKFMTVSFNDQDQSKENNECEFKLESNCDIFAIHSREGYIYTQKQMTTSDLGDCVLKIIVSNTGELPLQSSVIVNVEIDKSQPKTQNFQTEVNKEHIPGSSISFYNSGIIIIIMAIIIVIVVFVILMLICLGLRHCNRGPVCLRNLLDKFFHSNETQFKTTFNKQDEIMKDQFHEYQSHSNNWTPINTFDAFNPTVNYTKLAVPFPSRTHVYHTIDNANGMNNYDSWIANPLPISIPSQKKFDNCKSEMTLNTETLFRDPNDELSQIHDFRKQKWMSSLTPMPTRSKSVTSRVLSNEDSENNFAVIYPQEQSTFV